MRLTRTTAPSAEPVSVAEVKTHLRITVDDEDSYLDTLIPAARQHTEEYLSRALITQTWALYLDRFAWPYVELPRPPLQSVGSVKYVDDDGITQTVAASEYTVDTDSEPGRVFESYDGEWPSHRTVEKAVTITYDAGYGANASDVPQTIRHAILLLVGHMYENREASSPLTIKTVPMAYDSLLAPYRIHTL